MKSIILKIFGYTFSGIIILLAAAIPVGGLYYLGESIFYVTTYERDTGIVVSCSREAFSSVHSTVKPKSSGGAKYAPVVKVNGGKQITSKSYEGKESCYAKKGQEINILINPDNKNEAIINTFKDRWLVPLGLLSVPGILLFFYVRKRNA